MKCPDCGALNAEEMTKCGNCGKLLSSDASAVESQGEDRERTEERWNKIISANHSPESVEAVAQNVIASDKTFKLASWVLIAALSFLVLGFVLQVYSGEKGEELSEGLFSGDFTDIMGTLEDIENIGNATKWAGYLQSIGLILLAAGLVGLTVGVSKRL